MLEENTDRGATVAETHSLKQTKRVVNMDGLDTEERNIHRHINQYALLCQIGTGQHGIVFKAVDNSKKGANRGCYVAVKKVSRKHKSDKMQKLRTSNANRFSSKQPQVVNKVLTHEDQIMREISIMKRCNHPNVVRLYEVINDPLKRTIYIIMEYLGGGEIKWKTDNTEPTPTLKVEQTRRIMRDAILGLEYLHSQGIVHRDIKPANLLYTEDRSQVKIADFGVSHATIAEEFKNSEADSQHVFDQLAKMAGTPAFLAPELIYLPANGETDVPSQRPPITKAIDIWALGVTMYCLLFGITPFNPIFTTENVPPLAREQQLYAAIRNDDFKVPRTMGSDRVPTGGRHPEEGTRSYTIIHLLDHLIEKDPTERIEMPEIKNYPWFTQDVTSSWLIDPTPPMSIDVAQSEPVKPVGTLWKDTWTSFLRIPIGRSKKSSSDRSHPHRKRAMNDIGTRSVPSSRSSRRGSFPSRHGDILEDPFRPRSKKESRRSKRSTESEPQRVSSTNHDRSITNVHVELLGADCTACPTARNRSRQTLVSTNGAMESRSSNINLEERPPSSLAQRLVGFLGLSRRPSRQHSFGPTTSSTRLNGEQQVSRSLAAEQTSSIHNHFSERRATSWGDLQNDVASAESTMSEIDIQSQFVGAGGVGLEVIRANSTRGGSSPNSSLFSTSESSSVGGQSTPQPMLPHLMVGNDHATTIPLVPEPSGMSNGAPARQHGVSPLAGSPLTNGAPLTNGSSVHSDGSPYGSEGSRRSDEYDRDDKYEGDQFEEDDASDSDEGIEIQTGRRHPMTSAAPSPASSPPS